MAALFPTGRDAVTACAPPAVPHLIACAHCDLIHREVALPHHGQAVCTRCGAELYESGVHTVDHALALALSAAVLWLFANVFPLLRFNLQGSDAYTTIAGAAWVMARQDMGLLAILIAWAALLAPAMLIAAMLWVLVPLWLGRVPTAYGLAMRTVRAMQPWAMVEVLMLGVLVSMVKLDKTGVVEASPGAWMCVGLMLVLAALGLAFDARMIWRRIDALLEREHASPSSLTPGKQSAAASDLAVCDVCGLICHAHGDGVVCPRCAAPLHLRRPQSISRCLALLTTSLILYLPANLWVIMETASPFSLRRDTIVSGVVYLWQEGSQDLAVIVFIASVVVPLLKILALGLLLGCVRWGWAVPKQQQARLYRVVEIVGKWSMLDLFVIALLTSVVDFGSMAAVRPGPAAVAFGAVVVLTMLAASAFDPRLIWDEEHKRMKNRHG